MSGAREALEKIAKQKPFMWVCIVPGSWRPEHIQTWTRDPDQAETMRENGLDMIALYAAPQPVVTGGEQPTPPELTLEQIAIIDDMQASWIDDDKTYRKNFREDCRRLLATASHPSSSVVTTADETLDCQEYMPLALKPLENPNHDPGEHWVLDVATAHVFRIGASRERAERIVATLNAAYALSRPHEA